ncbi:hypothetical protein F2P81_006833 [Scophthalmus maximus]|uniref:DEP domain-containing protein n=1 Tax=Scophthalmus maximus TaxID=52904 RepID=A0A6A4T714_SCOMX|nr:hypothetical protein F2P81_006833 [Scophthalmus maximus]
MASIRERAAALNLAEKLCVRPQGGRGVAAGKPAAGPQSSSLWSGLISHLRASVTVKRRRVHLRAHGDCFLGSEAVDVVTEHVNHAKDLEGASVSRDKVVSVCQALLECNVFEAVGTKGFGKDKKQDVFQDSKSSLYRFVNVHMPSVDELERGVLGNGIQTLFCSAPSDRQDEQTRPTGSTPVELPAMSTTASRPDARVTAGLSVEAVERQSRSPSKVQTDSVLPPSLVEEVWHEQTLLRLLNLVELPLLEGLLQCSQTPSSPRPSHPLSHNNPDLIHSSNHLDRQILKAFRDTQEDEWLCAALDCLDFLSDQPVVELSRELPHCFPQDQEEGCDRVPAAGSQDGGKRSDQRQCAGSVIPSLCDCDDSDEPRRSQSGLAQWKLLLYRTLVKHYGHADRPPLLPQHMTDVYAAVTDLLVNAKLDKALEALQLCLKLLPPGCRDELRRLLTFMTLAADHQAMKLDKEMENRLAVQTSFSRAIVHSKALSKESEDLLVVFMLSNMKEIFKIPGALHKGVSEKLASLVQGKQPDVTASPLRFVSKEELMETAKGLSNMALAHEIIVNPTFQVKPTELPEGSFERRVKEIMQKAFWDVLEEQLKDDPPCYDHAIKLLAEIKEILLSFLRPCHDRQRSSIEEVLDLPLVRQQAENGALDMGRLSQFVIRMMGLLCAPSRDEDIDKLKDITDVVPLFKAIFSVLDLMKLDMANVALSSIRPHLMQQSVEYERNKFHQFLEKQPNALDYTEKWLEEAVKYLRESGRDGSGAASSDPPPLLPVDIHNHAYLRLLRWDHSSDPFPETVLMDQARFQEMQQEADRLVLLSSVLLIVYTTTGEAISGLPGLMETLKSTVNVMLADMHTPSFSAEEALATIGEKLCVELSQCLSQHGYSPLSADRRGILMGQISATVQPDNTVHKLMDSRVQTYLLASLESSQHKSPPPLPGGLAPVGRELTELAVHFSRLVNFNKLVFSPFYQKILQSMLTAEEAGGTET